MVKEVLVDGLTPQQHKEVLSNATKIFGKDSVSDGTNTLVIKDYMVEIIDTFSDSMPNEKNLRNWLKNIDLSVNVEDGNLIPNGYGGYKIIGTQNNKFSKAYNKAVRDFKKEKDAVNPEKITQIQAEKEAKKKWLDEFKESMQEGTVLVDSGNSRAVFYTVENVYLTKQNKVKAVDVRYTDSAEASIQGHHTVTPGQPRYYDDSFLYENCPVTSRGVVIEKRYSGGTWDTVGVLYDEDYTYSYDSCA